MADNNLTYLDYYKARVFRAGTTYQERVSNNLNQDFKQLLKTSPNSVEITYNGEQYECILNSGNSRIGAQNERKVIQYLLTDLDFKLEEGAVFSMRQPLENEVTNWICLHREIHSYYGYYKFKIVELDYDLKYVNNDGDIVTVPAYINGTGEFDIKAYFRYSLNTIEEVPNRALNVIWAANPEIVTDLRIMIGDEVWKVVDSDKISIPGVYYTTLFKTTLDLINDSVEEQVADITKTEKPNPNINTISQFGTLTWDINATSARLDDDTLGTISVTENQVIFIANDIIGTTNLHIYQDEEEISTKIIEVQSLWVT